MTCEERSEIIYHLELTVAYVGGVVIGLLIGNGVI